MNEVSVSPAHLPWAPLKLPKYAFSAVFLCLAIDAAAQGVPYAEGPLLDIVESMPDGTWKKVNANAFSDVWAPTALRPLYGTSSNPTPSKILGAWSSFAWDSKRGDLILYGGGHANYSGNDVYQWRARDLQWRRAALPSETLFVGSATWNAIDGADAAPTSAHTYDNAVYLPVADRYLNFGGAIHNTGGAYTRPDELNPGTLRITGPYLFDPSRADPDKVGGTTGSHVQRVAPYAEIVGGNMWENRDIHKHLAHVTRPRSHVNGCTAYSQSPAGHDVVYVGARTGGTALDLYRYELIDLDNPALDQISRVGVFWSSPSGQTTCAHDPILDVVLRTGTNASPFYFWDISPERFTNREQRVAVSGSVKDLSDWLTYLGRPITHCAIDYDPVRAHFVLWCGTGELWSVTPPPVASTEGWTVEPLSAPIGEVPPDNVGVGILGKWKYIPGFDVFMGLENSTLGNIWIYKPANWTAPGDGGGDPGDGDPPDDGTDPEDPPPVNQVPVINLTQPTTETVVSTGDTLLLQADAGDPDGTVAMVVFKINGNAIGMSNVAPFAASWTPASAGTYTVSAEASDNAGATTATPPLVINVQDPVEPGFEARTVSIQQGMSGYAGAGDTYLSSYHKTSNFGSSVRMDLDRSNYVPLIRFAVFASEGGPIPNGAIIESATLRLYKGNYDSFIALHAMLVPWVETQATWNRPMVGSTWSVAGAGGADSDYDSTADASVTAPWSAGWIELDVANRLRAFASGTPNHGWRLVAGAGNSNRKELRSSNYATAADTRPMLEITWRPADPDGDPDDPEATPNQAPTVSLSQPLNSAVVETGSLVPLRAEASDTDGSLVRVSILVNGVELGTATSSPFELPWVAGGPGIYVISALAEDNDGATAVSSASITVQAPPPAEGESVTTILQRGITGYAGVMDTYLSSYHKTSNFGASNRMDLDRNNYAPLLRFAVFVSEGGTIPDGATIESATLHLNKGVYDGVIGLHAMRVNWSESEATWNRASTLTSWNLPGAGGAGSDYEFIADAQVNAPWNAGELAFDVTERIQGIAAGESNMGWRLVAGTGNNNRKQISSSENITDNLLRPKLEVTWSLPSAD